ncbi:inositol monophosphatase [Acrocarpospora pleiomorpha]|uniref:inositol-phosphate phosphatase n=1 Tax=Acrocarpospora pleiomorpha TaxID=90975 RepID=A0A5M3XY56_9ACTN|nr:inositol monophosphatase family protein [Acrocarpospora pleiomorpha]GES24939.1 inositol monophosphatase [Acrocarpospora pleiomorpha]
MSDAALARAVSGPDHPLTVLEVALQAARAGAAVVALADRPRSARAKEARGDVVTDIDVAAERAITSELARTRPGDRVIGEESGVNESDAPTLEWYVDPIDGTTNFLLGLPHYAVSVAAYSPVLAHWIAGVVITPALRITYGAARGYGAWAETDEGRQALSACCAPGAPRILATGLSYDADLRATQVEDLSRALHGFDDVRALGSAALALCAVAAGHVDSYVESDLYVYDWAAGALIAEEAGATVVRPPLTRGGISAQVRRSG